MEEPEQLVLHRPEALHRAIGILNKIQEGPWTNRPLIGATLDALDNGDVGTAMFHLDAAQLFTITGRQDVAAAASLVRQAFDI